MRPEEALIRSWKIDLSLSPHAGHELEMEAAALLDIDLTEVLPYLNAELQGSRYTPSIPALVWMHKDHQIGILKDRIVLDHVHEDDDVEALLTQIIEEVNQIWARKESIQPRYSPRTFRQPLEIYTLLPQTNCKACGEPTCYSYALKLTAGISKLTECTPLFEADADRENRATLERIVLEKDPTQ
ncbi:MAG: (Fe-S)-binding protein [Anaerolineales bacterium]|jgi:ArsR family metal-binding transcriptional regulator